MFNYLKEKNKIFFSAVESYLDGTLNGVLLKCEDEKPHKTLYCAVFKDEAGYKRTLWCPAPIFEDTELYQRLNKSDKIVFVISRRWHESKLKVEDMVFSGRLFYLPSAYKKWTEKNKKEA